MCRHVCTHTRAEIHDIHIRSIQLCNLNLEDAYMIIYAYVCRDGSAHCSFNKNRTWYLKFRHGEELEAQHHQSLIATCLDTRIYIIIFIRLYTYICVLTPHNQKNASCFLVSPWISMYIYICISTRIRDVCIWLQVKALMPQCNAK